MSLSPAFNPVFARQGTTIFTVMSALATEHKAVNLGQGFPDLDGPDSVRARAARALMERQSRSAGSTFSFSLPVKAAQEAGIA